METHIIDVVMDFRLFIKHRKQKKNIGINLTKTSDRRIAL